MRDRLIPSASFFSFGFFVSHCFLLRYIDQPPHILLTANNNNDNKKQQQQQQQQKEIRVGVGYMMMFVLELMVLH